MIKTIIIPEDFSAYIQSLQYETYARFNLCAFCLRNNIQNESFEKYHNEYIEFNAEYQIAKSELENIYVIPEIGDNKNYTWTLNFNTNEVIINVNE